MYTCAFSISFRSPLNTTSEIVNNYAAHLKVYLYNRRACTQYALLLNYFLSAYLFGHNSSNIFMHFLRMYQLSILMETSLTFTCPVFNTFACRRDSISKSQIIWDLQIKHNLKLAVDVTILNNCRFCAVFVVLWLILLYVGTGLVASYF